MPCVRKHLIQAHIPLHSTLTQRLTCWKPFGLLSNAKLWMFVAWERLFIATTGVVECYFIQYIAVVHKPFAERFSQHNKNFSRTTHIRLSFTSTARSIRLFTRPTNEFLIFEQIMSIYWFMMFFSWLLLYASLMRLFLNPINFEVIGFGVNMPSCYWYFRCAMKINQKVAFLREYSRSYIEIKQ